MPIKQHRDIHAKQMQGRTVEDWHEDRVDKFNMVHGKSIVVHDDVRPLQAYVNDDRWVIDCQCGAGNAVDIETATARCAECGAVHTVVTIPADHAEIESVLLERPERNRNWKATETLEDIQAENRAHGVRVP